MPNSRLYELIYVVVPTATDQEVTDLHEQVMATIGRFGATLVKTENWGRRKLAYQVGGHKEATYVLELIEGGGELMKELDRRLKVSEQVLRHLVVRVDEELQAAERLRLRRQADTERRAARSGVAAARPAAAGGEEPPAADEGGQTVTTESGSATTPEPGWGDGQPEKAEE